MINFFLFNTELRLSGGSIPNEGRVEVKLNGFWGSVCDTNWNINTANVACRQLGYMNALETNPSAYFGEGKTPHTLHGANCIGNETRLKNCEHQGVSIDDDTHHGDVGVVCAIGTFIFDTSLSSGF